MTVPNPAAGKPVQRKVAVATAASYIGGLLLAAVVQSLQDGSLIAALPPVASAILAPLIPSILVFLGGYMTRNRIDQDDVSQLTRAVEAEVARRIDEAVQAAIAKYVPKGDRL